MAIGCADVRMQAWLTLAAYTRMRVDENTILERNHVGCELPSSAQRPRKSTDPGSSQNGSELGRTHPLGGCVVKRIRGP